MSSLPILLLGLTLALAGCGREDVATSEATAERAAGASCCAAAPESASARGLEASGTLTGESIYALKSQWKDQTGRRLQLGDLAGRPRVLAMVFTHCEYACPRILAELRELEAALAAAPEDGPGFVLVSFDSARDDPATLAAYAEAQGLDPRRWTLLHGDAASVRELSVVLDVAYRADADGGFSHASVISVLDAAGRLVHEKRGLGGDLAASRAAIAALLPAAPHDSRDPPRASR